MARRRRRSNPDPEPVEEPIEPATSEPTEEPVEESTTTETTEPSAPALTQKDPEDYEYKIRIDRIENDQVCILCEEVDGNDGFAVWLPVEEVEKLSPEELIERIQPDIDRRIEMLVELKRKEEEERRKLELVKKLKESKVFEAPR
jgi:hypothetical protein